MAGITELSFLIESWCLLSDKRKTGDSRRIDNTAATAEFSRTERYIMEKLERASHKS